MIDIIGYIGMFIILSSFLADNVKWLRIINIIGSAFSVTYGFITKTYPTAILNILLIIINSIYLVIIIRRERNNKK